MTDAELAQESLRSPGTALLLDLLLPGVGHIYGTAGQKGVAILVVNLLCAATIPFVYVTFIFNVVIWIAAMASSHAVTNAHNTAIRNAIERIATAATEEKERETKRRIQAETELRLLVTGRELAGELGKLDGLRRMKILDDTEFGLKKQALLEELVRRKSKETMADFFSPLAPLLESKTLTPEDLERIKRAFAQISSPV